MSRSSTAHITGHWYSLKSSKKAVLEGVPEFVEGRGLFTQDLASGDGVMEMG
ncbi:MAG: hypothetical protein F6K03_16655 [Kamptonema sp. SIO4C4]|nr:hypothetical protein [Kamptonema sp. SIO4C4]